SAGAQSASCATTVTFTGSAADTISVSATYTPGGGDATHITSQGSGSIPVSKISTATTVSSSLTPTTYGQAVTFTATVSISGPGTGTPAGTVTFKDGGTALICTGVGDGALSGGGQATCTTSSLTGGSHTITVFYGGDANFATSDDTASPLTQTVNKATTSTAVSSSLNPSTYGQT